MYKLRLLLLAVAAACAVAFMPPVPVQARQATKLYAAPNLLTQADLCLNGECSVEDVSELLTQIRVKVKDLKEQTAALQQLEAELTGKNMPGQDVDQVRALIKSVLRALDIDPEDDNFPDIVRAAGFSGTPFKGKVEEAFPAWKKA